MWPHLDWIPDELRRVFVPQFAAVMVVGYIATVIVAIFKGAPMAKKVTMPKMPMKPAMPMKKGGKGKKGC